MPLSFLISRQYNGFSINYKYLIQGVKSMKQKHFYYIIVQSEGQAKFVTKIDNSTKTARWEANGKPLALSKYYAEELSVEIDHYEEKDYTEADNKIELLNLKPRDRAVVDCYMAGMTCNEIAEFLDIDRITVWRRRTRAQVKYKALFF